MRDELSEKELSLPIHILEELSASQEELDNIDDASLHMDMNTGLGAVLGAGLDINSLSDMPFELPNLDMGMDLLKNLPIKEMTNQCTQQ